MKTKSLTLLTTLGILFLLNISAESDHVQAKPNASFGDYWYKGKAELNRFELKQVRYGEIRNGDAVLVFVTEDFLPQKQVKYEYKPSDEQPVSVLKLNFTRKFLTGIYPYSIMSSVFTPVKPEVGKTLKVTTTVQEWCGQTFMQINHRDQKYDIQLRSYFQNESDQDLQLTDIWLEDALWTQIRLDPGKLPQGNVELLPGTQYLRLAHQAAVAQPANVSIMETQYDKQKQYLYTITYKNIPRQLKIRFSSEFPYEIISWEESDGKANGLKTIATRTHSLMLDYWSKNGNQDLGYRGELGLSQ